jgi:O-antigen/teichoic acid export membrane protein
MTILEKQSEAIGISLRRSFGWAVVGNATYSICQWIILVVLAKFCTTQQVGKFGLGLALTAPIFMFLNLQLRSIQATDVKDENTLAHYLGLRLITITIALIAIILLVLWTGYNAESMCVILIIGISKAIESLSDVLYGLFQRHERLDWISHSMILRGTLSVGLLTLAMVASGSLIWGVITLAVTWAGVLVLHDIPRSIQVLPSPSNIHGSPNGRSILTSLTPSFNARILGRLAWLAMPLGLVTMLSSLNVNIPRYFIESHLGEAKLGIYVAIAAVFSGMYFLQIALGQAVLPRLASYYASGMIRAYLRIAGIVLGFGLFNGILIVAIVFIGGSNVLRIIYSEEFVPFDHLFLWLAVASIVQCANGALTCFLLAARHFKESTWACLINTFVVLVCSAWFIPRFSEIGAAYAMLAGSSISFFILIIQLIVILFLSKGKLHAAKSFVHTAHEKGDVSRNTRLSAAPPY